MLKVFTIFKEKPIHPRLEMQMKWWKNNNIPFKIYYIQPEKEFYFKVINRLTLKMTRWDLVALFKKEINPKDTVLIYDYTLLPLVKFAKNKNAKVYFETLDDNPYLLQHAYEKKSFIFKIIKPLTLNYLIKRETFILRTYADKVIVNSTNLLKLKDKNCFFLPYSSPFESHSIGDYNKDLPCCFLYIGKLTIDKGAMEYKNLVEKFNLNFVFAGEAKDDFSKKWIQSLPQKNYLGFLNSTDLLKELNILSKKYNIIGLSIIWPSNKSYAMQEANKDIDYLALKIPFIGNERIPTFEKIKSGAAVYYNDHNAITSLIENKEDLYTKIQINQSNLYFNKYSSTIFNQMMNKIYNE